MNIVGMEDPKNRLVTIVFIFTVAAKGLRARPARAFVPGRPCRLQPLGDRQPGDHLDRAAGGTTLRARPGATLTFEAPPGHAHASDWPSADPIRARPTSRQPEALHPATVLTIIDRYLIRQILLTCLVMTGIGLAILVLERVLQLFSLVANPNQAFRYVGQMLVLLLPHYLSIALPAAFFFGVLLTFRRLQRDSEFVVLAAAGRSLGRLLAPALGLALVMTVLAALIVGWLAPHARYGYRALKAQVAEASLTAAVLGGTFIQARGITFFAEQARARGRRPAPRQGVRPPGGRGRRRRWWSPASTACSARSRDERDPGPDPQGGPARRAAGRGRPTSADLRQSQLAGDRRRGGELPAARPRPARAHAAPSSGPSRRAPPASRITAEIAAELHARLVLIAIGAAPAAAGSTARARRRRCAASAAASCSAC